MPGSILAIHRILDHPSVELCFAAKNIQKFGIEVGNPVLRSSNYLVGLNLVVVPDKSVFLYIAHKGKFKKGKFENKMKYLGSDRMIKNATSANRLLTEC